MKKKIEELRIPVELNKMNTNVSMADIDPELILVPSRWNTQGWKWVKADVPAEEYFTKRKEDYNARHDLLKHPVNEEMKTVPDRWSTSGWRWVSKDEDLSNANTHWRKRFQNENRKNYYGLSPLSSIPGLYHSKGHADAV